MKCIQNLQQQKEKMKFGNKRLSQHYNRPVQKLKVQERQESMLEIAFLQAYFTNT